MYLDSLTSAMSHFIVLCLQTGPGQEISLCSGYSLWYTMMMHELQRDVQATRIYNHWH